MTARSLFTEVMAHAVARHPSAVSALDFKDRVGAQVVLEQLTKQKILRDIKSIVRDGKTSFRLYGLTSQGEQFLPHHTRRKQ